MSQIRRQSIISTVFVYAGFFIGFINTYLFTRQGSPFTPSQYGLASTIFIAVGNLMFAFANMGMISVIYKFYPYYKDNLPKRKNDLLTWALLTSLIGFGFVIIAGIIFKEPGSTKIRRSLPGIYSILFLGFPIRTVAIGIFYTGSICMEPSKINLYNILKRSTFSFINYASYFSAKL